MIGIVTAMIYYCGWHRLDAKTHEIVGWACFVAAWMSLVIINGILSFMLTLGRWLETHAFADGFFDPTYVPSTVLRTFVAIGGAGPFALRAAARLADGGPGTRIARWATMRWVLPVGAGVLPASPWRVAFLFAASSDPAEHAAREGEQLYDEIGRLPELNEVMPGFEGTDRERRKLAGFPAGLETTR